MTITAYTKTEKLLVKDASKFPSEFDPFQRSCFPKAFKIGKTIPYVKGTVKSKK